MFYREFEHHGKDLDAASFIDNFRYILHYLCKNARKKALILHFQHGMIKLGITSLQVRQHRENFGFFFLEGKETIFLIYLEKIQIPVPRKQDPHLKILYETKGSILFEKDFTDKKVFGEGKENCFWHGKLNLNGLVRKNGI